MTEQKPILCPGCDHDIDEHEQGSCSSCQGNSGCTLWPSHITRALLAAAPTAAAVDAAVDSLMAGDTRWRDTPLAEFHRSHARRAIIAARQAEVTQ